MLRLGVGSTQAESSPSTVVPVSATEGTNQLPPEDSSPMIWHEGHGPHSADPGTKLPYRAERLIWASWV